MSDDTQPSMSRRLVEFMGGPSDGEHVDVLWPEELFVWAEARRADTTMIGSYPMGKYVPKDETRYEWVPNEDA